MHSLLYPNCTTYIIVTILVKLFWVQLFCGLCGTSNNNCKILSTHFCRGRCSKAQLLVMWPPCIRGYSSIQLHVCIRIALRYYSFSSKPLFFNQFLWTSRHYYGIHSRNVSGEGSTGMWELFYRVEFINERAIFVELIRVALLTAP